MTLAPERVVRSAEGTAERVARQVVTGAVIAECVVGGAFDVARQPPFFPTLVHLGYPPYLSTMLGVAKLLAGAVLVLRVSGRLRRFLPLEEWAYAGILVNMVGAAWSHLAAGDGVGAAAPPASFAVLALVSWGLRRRARSER